jgi:acetyl esterase
MTTTMHESYLRKWSNKLKIPILGLNYHLSPEVKYPKAIDDIYQSYIWIIKNGKKELNLDFEYLILSGDSAGGSLLLSLIFLLIYKNKFENLNIKLPDLIIAQYPCCNTSIFNMNYSLMLSLKDFLLNDDFLKYVYYSYRGNYLNDNDPFLNPEKVTLDILKFLPRTRFFFGGADPLRDDIIRLIYKISQVNNLDFKAYQFQFYAHGFYGLDNEVLQKNPTEILLNEIEEFLKEKNC